MCLQCGSSMDLLYFSNYKVHLKSSKFLRNQRSALCSSAVLAQLSGPVGRAFLRNLNG